MPLVDVRAVRRAGAPPNGRACGRRQVFRNLAALRGGFFFEPGPSFLELVRYRFVFPPSGMTLDQLAQAMRGMPRDALIMIRTPEGLREVRLVKPCYVRDDGTPRSAAAGARYAIIPDDDAWEPQSSQLAGA